MWNNPRETHGHSRPRSSVLLFVVVIYTYCTVCTLHTVRYKQCRAMYLFVGKHGADKRYAGVDIV